MTYKPGLYNASVYVTFFSSSEWEMWDGKTCSWTRWQGTKIGGHMKPHHKEKLAVPMEYLT